MDEWKRMLLRCLERSDVFCDLDARTLRGLCGVARSHRYRKHDLVHEQGEAADDLVVVLEGRLGISRRVSSNRTMHLRTLRAGAIVGWSILAGEPHTADLVAESRLRVARIAGAPVRRLFADHPEVPLRMIASLGALVGRLSGQLEDARYKTLDERVWASVVEIGSIDEKVRITQTELAEHVGVSREHASRALGRLAGKGLLERGRGWIRRLR